MGFLSYNSILNYHPSQKIEPTCGGCNNFDPLGGGKTEVLCRCLAGQPLWTAKNCSKFAPKTIKQKD